MRNPPRATYSLPSDMFQARFVIKGPDHRSTFPTRNMSKGQVCAKIDKRAKEIVRSPTGQIVSVTLWMRDGTMETVEWRIDRSVEWKGKP
jgi:hypothetical protein